MGDKHYPKTLDHNPKLSVLIIISKYNNNNHNKRLYVDHFLSWISKLGRLLFQSFEEGEDDELVTSHKARLFWSKVFLIGILVIIGIK